MKRRNTPYDENDTFSYEMASDSLLTIFTSAKHLVRWWRQSELQVYLNKPIYVLQPADTFLKENFSDLNIEYTQGIFDHVKELHNQPKLEFLKVGKFFEIYENTPPCQRRKIIKIFMNFTIISLNYKRSSARFVGNLSVWSFRLITFLPYSI